MPVPKDEVKEMPTQTGRSRVILQYIYGQPVKSDNEGGMQRRTQIAASL